MNNKYYLDDSRRVGITKIEHWVHSISGYTGTFKRLDEIHRRGFYNEGDRVFLNHLRTQYQRRDKNPLTSI